jgi:hypothetical protein
MLKMIKKNHRHHGFWRHLQKIFTKNQKTIFQKS